MRHRHRYPVLQSGEPKRPHHERQQHRPLRHREPRPGANPGACRKRHIGLPRRRLSGLTLPAARVERIGRLPKPRVPVQVPGRQHDLAAYTERAVPEGLGPGRFAHHHRHRRVEPERLAEHVAGDAQFRQGREIRRLGQARRLLGHPVLPVGMGGQQVQRPGQGRGRGFVPRQKEDRHLVDHFRGGERLARLRITGRHDLGGKIVGRGAGPDLGHARGGHSGDQFTDPAGRRPGPGAVAARHPARQGQERAGIQDGLRALIGAKGVEDLVCHVIVDRHREKRAEDHVRCRVAHLGLDLHLAPGQTRHRRQTCRPHRR